MNSSIISYSNPLELLQPNAAQICWTLQSKLPTKVSTLNLVGEPRRSRRGVELLPAAGPENSFVFLCVSSLAAPPEPPRMMCDYLARLRKIAAVRCLWFFSAATTVTAHGCKTICRRSCQSSWWHVREEGETAATQLLTPCLWSQKNK